MLAKRRSLGEAKDSKDSNSAPRLALLDTQTTALRPWLQPLTPLRGWKPDEGVSWGFIHTFYDRRYSGETGFYEYGISEHAAAEGRAVL